MRLFGGDANVFCHSKVANSPRKSPKIILFSEKHYFSENKVPKFFYSSGKFVNLLRGEKGVNASASHDTAN